MRPPIHPETLQMIVEDYGRDAEARRREVRWWTASGEPFSTVIERAARAQLQNGKRHPHQYRISRAVLDSCVEALLEVADQLQGAPDFHRMLSIVEKALKPIRGAGELTAYDIADRLRHRLGLASKHIIYLHAGTRTGARRLAGGRLANYDAWGICNDQLPEELRALDNHEAEDVLCTYKDVFLLGPDALKVKLTELSHRGRDNTGEKLPGC